MESLFRFLLGVITLGTGFAMEQIKYLLLRILS